jgi:hypothetical protein
MIVDAAVIGGEKRWRDRLNGLLESFTAKGPTRKPGVLFAADYRQRRLQRDRQGWIAAR